MGMIWLWKLVTACAVALATTASLGQAAELAQGRKLSDSFSFVLNGESNRHYLIQCSQDFTNWVTATNSISRETNRLLEVALPFPSRAFFRTVQTNEPVFPSALVARTAIDLYGNNLRTDSYDSGNPSCSTSGRYDIVKSQDHGDLIANGTITNTINVGNLTVAGRLQVGPLASTTHVGPQGSVGDHAWLAAGMMGIQPGHWDTNAHVFWPDVVLPSGSFGWLPMVSGTVEGVFYNAVVTNSGDYLMPSGDLSGKILVAAPGVRLRLDGGINFTGQGGIILTSNASLTIYMNGSVANFGGNGIVNPGTPTNFLYFGTPKNTTLTIGVYGETTGAFYAPHADVTLQGGGANDQELSGTVVGRAIRLTGSYYIHYDEALARGPWKPFVALGE
jgi:hypothetical protein